MARETKVGLLMVVMLVGVFGFMVYKQMHRPLEGLAEQKAESGTPESEAEVLPFANSGDKGDGLTPPSNQVITAAAAAPAVIPENKSAVRVAPRAETPRDPDPFDLQPTPTTNVKPKLPTSIPRDDDFFDAQSKPTVAVQKPEPVIVSSSPVASSDPFMEEPKPTARTNASAVQNNVPVERPTTTNTDPFEAPLEVARSAPQAATQSSPVEDPFVPVPSSVSAADPFLEKTSPPKKTVSQPTLDFEVIEEPERTAPALTAPVFEPASSNQTSRFESAATTPASSGIRFTPRTTTPATTTAEDDRLGGFRPVEVSKRAMNEFTREERTATTAIPASDPFDAARRPAPAARIDEDFAPRTTSQALVPGDTYNIEPNDNYWTISRKKYGTGRYFMALSQHNLQVIPDPKRMKPGVTIATPSTDVLDKTYPTLIPKAAPSDSAPAVGASAPSTAIRRTNATANDEAGFFVSNDGVPMYRVGTEDTLSDIAKQHLGRSSRWVQIFEMNRDTLTDGNTLKVGILLRLPGDASRVDVVGTPRTVR